MAEQWIVFRDRETGEELAAYTARGTFPGEATATAELLAAERGITPEQITARAEARDSRRPSTKST